MAIGLTRAIRMKACTVLIERCGCHCGLLILTDLCPYSMDDIAIRE
jgi:hypothetical protein